MRSRRPLLSLTVAGLLLVVAFPVVAQEGPCAADGSCPVGQTCLASSAGGALSCFKTCSPTAGSTTATECTGEETCIPLGSPAQNVCVGASGVESGELPAGSAEEAPEAAFTPITPNLGVDIPGLELTPASQAGGAVSVPFLAQYINALYRYAIGITLVVAIIMVVYGGFRYLVGAGVGGVQRGKEIIRDAIVGMLLVISAYLILNTLNPATTALQVLSLTFVEGLTSEELEILESDFITPEPGADIAGGGDDFVAIDRESMVRVNETCIRTNTEVDPSMAEPLRRAGERFCELRGSNTNWRIVGGGFRSPDLSLRLWLRRCLNRVNCLIATGAPLPRSLVTTDSAGRKIISEPAIQALAPPPPDASRPYTDAQLERIYEALLPRAGVRSGSGHGLGLAVDLFCAGATTSQENAYVPCQLLLEQAMRSAGFCRIANEWWHFELASNPRSRNCSASWTIGQVSIRVGTDSSPTTFRYDSCPGFFSARRAQQGVEPCRR